MNLDKYLSRINYTGDLTPKLDTLTELQKSHLFNIPFENLDIHNNVVIELSIDKIYDKIVNQKRGGFCYELNGLFYELLQTLGFEAKIVSARVYDKDKGYGKEFDHLAIIVTINNIDYLSDVGFGEFIFDPLALHLGVTQNDGRGTYVIEKFENEYLRVNKIEDWKSTPQYIFKTIKRELFEFEEMCNYHQTSPNSHFTRKRLISLPTENGRITITGNKLKIKKLESVNETEIKDETEFNDYLQQLFYK